MEKKKSTGLLLSILGVISLVLITAGVTYAFFSYTKEGTKTNTITTGAITFHYAEDDSAFTLNNALPMSDANGVTQTNGDTNNNIEANNFEFTITSTTPSSAKIPYVVTLRNLTTSGKTLPTDQVKIYLKATGSSEDSYTGLTANNRTYTGSAGSEVVNTYSTLNNTSTFDWYNNATGAANGVNAGDVIIYEGVVPADSSNYSKTFNLGMWLKLADSGMTDYSAYEFVKKSAITSDTTGTSVATLESGNNILTSTEYYRRLNMASTDDNYATQHIVEGDWARIKYRDYTNGLVITDQTTLTSVPEGFENANEQYYPLSTKEFKVRVNVYAEGAVVLN